MKFIFTNKKAFGSDYGNGFISIHQTSDGGFQVKNTLPRFTEFCVST
ncbi:hypothetical protein [Stenoxybacter acetivorans]|nr:hypothetical protein [Stenoxybacter acetivorans]